MLVAGCGGSAQAPRPKPTPRPVDAGRQIRDVVLRSYTGTDPQDCARIFTSAFLTDAFGGVKGCEKHVQERPQRTVRVISIHRQGPVADAKIRVDRFDSTWKLRADR